MFQGGAAMSPKSIAKKLLIKSSTAVWSSDASHLDLIEPLPDGVRVVERLDQATTAVVFAHDAADLREVLDAHKDQLAAPTAFWIAYQKANRADINRDSLWPILAEYGMRPITQVAVDDTWSALRFRTLKQGEAPFTGGR
jgi:hypothetical protein